MAVQIPAQAILDSQAAGELWQVVLAIAGPESSWQAGALGDYKLYWGGSIVDRNTPGAFPTSFGYLQMHQDGGLGTGIPKETLLHGPTNMRLGAEYIRGRLGGGASLWDAMSPWSARPAAWELYGRIQREGIAGIGGATLPTQPIIPGQTMQTSGLAIAVAILLLLLLVD